MMNMHLNGNEVSAKSIEVENVCGFDYPDFCDAFIGYAEYVDGKVLSEKEIAKLEKLYPTLVNELAHASFC